MARTNIDIDDELVHRVMVRYQLGTKREAVDYTLRHLAGQPMTTTEALGMAGSIPDFDVPEDDFESAARIRGLARRIGLSIGAVDCMIVAVALRTSASLATLDSAQAAVASHLGLKVAPL